MDRKSALTVRSSSAPDRTALCVMSAPRYGAQALRATALNLHRRGEIQIVSRKPIWNERADHWEIEYRRLKPMKPRWRKPLLISLAILVPLGILGASLYWLAMTLAAVPLGTFLGVVFLGFVALLILGRSSSTFVDVLVRVRIR